MPALVFWDWNGTLLDDAAYALGVRNRTFPRFGLPTLPDLAAYRRQFTFPVSDYYRAAGVTDENFVAVADAWMAEYERGADAVPLFPDAAAALARFAAAGARQVVLSASQIGMLRAQLAHAGILACFAEVLGLSHIYATSKQDIGREYLRACGVPPQDCVLLGDTLHDADVARAMGIGCVLIDRGHQDEATLRRAGVPVCRSLLEACDTVLG